MFAAFNNNLSSNISANPGASSNNSSADFFQAAAAATANANGNAHLAALGGYPAAAAFGGAAPYSDAFQSALFQQHAAAASGQTPNFSALGMPGFGATFQHPALAQHFSQNVPGLQFPNAAGGIFGAPMSSFQQQNDCNDQHSVRS